MKNKEQLYSYKGINKQPTIKLPQETTRNQCSKTQTNLEKAAVQKGNPTEQGLKPKKGNRVSFDIEGVQKGNPTEQGLKQETGV